MSKENECESSEQTNFGEKCTTFIQSTAEKTQDNMDLGVDVFIYGALLVAYEFYQKSNYLLGFAASCAMLILIFIKSRVPEGTLKAFLNKKKLTKKEENLIEILKDLRSEQKSYIEKIAVMDEDKTMITIDRKEVKKFKERLKKEQERAGG